MPNETLADAIGSAYDAQGSQETAVEETVESTGSYIDIEDGSPSEGEQQGNTSAQQVAWELAQGVAPDQVIGTMDGKPVTAAEVRDSFFRTQDYTAKTQQIASERKELQSYKEWYEGAEPYLRGLNSQNPAEKMEAIQKIAQDYGVDIGGRARDERGRFAAQQEPGDGLIDLDQYIEGSAEWELASTINDERQRRSGLESRLEELGSKFEQFTGSVASAYEQNQRRSEAEAIAAKYQTSGLSELDIDGALKRVGEPLGVSEAMRLHHYDKIMRHNFNLARAGTPSSVPNEPAASANSNKGSLRGLSLTRAFDERVR